MTKLQILIVAVLLNVAVGNVTKHKYNPEAELKIWECVKKWSNYCLNKYGCHNKQGCLQNISNNGKKCVEFYNERCFANQPGYSPCEDNIWIQPVSSKPRPEATTQFDHLKDSCQSNPCENGGTCQHVFGTTFACTCPEGFSGLNCEVQTIVGDKYSYFACVNGATSESDKLKCPLGFNGTFYERNVNDSCESNQCQNGAECEDMDKFVDGRMTHYFKCFCQDGFEGRFCQSSLSASDACLSNPCENGAKCRHIEGTTFACYCPDGFFGSVCDGVDECIPNPCKNDGICHQDDDKKFIECVCPRDFSGLNCEVERIEDDGNSFFECVNGELSQPDKLKCICPLGFTGTFCERNVNDNCESNQCQNGANCVDMDIIVDSRMTHYFKCFCQDGFEGRFCQSSLSASDACLSNPCENGAFCQNIFPGNDRFACLCSDGFEGELCQFSLSTTTLAPNKTPTDTTTAAPTAALTARTCIFLNKILLFNLQ